MGVCVWFGALNMHRICGLSLAWHWQVVCGNMNSKRHSRIVCSGIVLLVLPTLVRV